MSYSTTAGCGYILHQNNTEFYILLTNPNDPLGVFNALRPFYIVGTTGQVNMNQGVVILNGLNVASGNTTLTNLVSLSGNVITGSALGRIYWINPNGTQTHWGYPSGGGSIYPITTSEEQ